MSVWQPKEKNARSFEEHYQNSISRLLRFHWNGWQHGTLSIGTRRFISKLFNKDNNSDYHALHATTVPYLVIWRWLTWEVFHEEVPGYPQGHQCQVLSLIVPISLVLRQHLSGWSWSENEPVDQLTWAIEENCSKRKFRGEIFPRIFFIQYYCLIK